MNIQKSVIIVAGGSGKRMNSDIPKQFMLLRNKPVLFYSIEFFYQFDPEIEIILVLPENQISQWKELCKEYSFSIKHKLIIGGDERFHSVKNGLTALNNDGFVAIHDGVRPLINKNIIQRCFNLAEEKGNAVPVLSVNESFQIINENGNSTFDRSVLRLVQTPQVFRVQDIKKAYDNEFHPGFTDDANVLEKMGHKINLCEGERKTSK